MKRFITAVLALVVAVAAATAARASAEESRSVYLPLAVRQLPVCDATRYLCAMED